MIVQFSNSPTTNCMPTNMLIVQKSDTLKHTTRVIFGARFYYNTDTLNLGNFGKCADAKS